MKDLLMLNLINEDINLLVSGTPHYLLAYLCKYVELFFERELRDMYK